MGKKAAKAEPYSSSSMSNGEAFWSGLIVGAIIFVIGYLIIANPFGTPKTNWVDVTPAGHSLSIDSLCPAGYICGGSTDYYGTVHFPIHAMVCDSDTPHTVLTVEGDLLDPAWTIYDSNGANLGTLPSLDSAETFADFYAKIENLCH
jgi:hypothetical protein